jgi:hypothetical protein
MIRYLALLALLFASAANATVLSGDLDLYEGPFTFGDGMNNVRSEYSMGQPYWESGWFYAPESGAGRARG